VSVFRGLFDCHFARGNLSRPGAKHASGRRPATQHVIMARTKLNIPGESSAPASSPVNKQMTAPSRQDVSFYQFCPETHGPLQWPAVPHWGSALVTPTQLFPARLSIWKSDFLSAHSIFTVICAVSKFRLGALDGVRVETSWPMRSLRNSTWRGQRRIATSASIRSVFYRMDDTR